LTTDIGENEQHREYDESEGSWGSAADSVSLKNHLLIYFRFNLPLTSGIDCQHSGGLEAVE